MLRAVAPPIRHWGFFTLSADQTAGLGVGAPIRFDIRQDGDIAMSGYRLTLPGRGTYSIEGVCRFNGTSATAGQLHCRWLNVTSGGSFGASLVILAQNVANATSVQPSAAALLTIDRPTDIELQITTATNVTRIHTNATYAKVIQIA